MSIASALDLSIGDKIARAAKLIKADLLTHMVGEFPELQGTMGRIYAEHQGEDPEIARGDRGALLSNRDRRRAAEERPRLPSWPLRTSSIPSSHSFLSASPLPAIVDPFALRRQAIGSIRTIIGKGYHIPLAEGL